MRFPRVLLLLAAIAALLAISVSAAQIVQFYVDAGTTVVEVAGQEVRIETSAPVIVSLSANDGMISGGAEPAAGVRGAIVSITVLGPPDTIIFKGKVTVPVWFEDALPHETGRGEQ